MSFQWPMPKIIAIKIICGALAVEINFHHAPVVDMQKWANSLASLPLPAPSNHCRWTFAHSKARIFILIGTDSPSMPRPKQLLSWIQTLSDLLTLDVDRMCSQWISLKMMKKNKRKNNTRYLISSTNWKIQGVSCKRISFEIQQSTLWNAEENRAHTKKNCQTVLKILFIPFGTCEITDIWLVRVRVWQWYAAVVVSQLNLFIQIKPTLPNSVPHIEHIVHILDHIARSHSRGSAISHRTPRRTAFHWNRLKCCIIQSENNIKVKWKRWWDDFFQQ